jgi:hypothetical protein
MISLLKAVKEVARAKKASKQLKKAQYYTTLEIPLFNFFECWKGNLNYLYKTNVDKPYPKMLFSYTFQEMYYQFKYLDNSYLRKLALLADYKSKHVRTENARWLNSYNTLKKELENIKKTDHDLDEFTDYIEHTFKYPPGSIDVHKISTSKAFSNFKKAVDYNKKLNSGNITK